MEPHPIQPHPIQEVPNTNRVEPAFEVPLPNGHVEAVVFDSKKKSETTAIVYAHTAIGLDTYLLVPLDKVWRFPIAHLFLARLEAMDDVSIKCTSAREHPAKRGS